MRLSDRLLNHLLTQGILGDRTAPFLLLRLGGGRLLGLGHQAEAHRHPHSLAAIQRRQEVDPFEHPIFGVVVVPADNIALAHEIKRDGQQQYGEHIARHEGQDRLVGPASADCRKHKRDGNAPNG